ncbi:MAG: AAA family ATPase [Deltaproteobacteria bacterium]|nr:MAG: AAA family ATPase [Deltaproteobacteria bacterium]
MSDAEQSAGREAEVFRRDFQQVLAEMSRVVVGLEQPMRAVLTCLLCGGHGLLEGVPGVGKTLLVTTLARCLSLRFARIQFTPDLMPADVTGTNIIESEGGQVGGRVRFRPGPIFANVVLADEINRATPKTQSALLEAMQEQQVTVGEKTRPLEQPFLVLATQNPLEMEGTYPLPEAQLDRFLFKIVVPYPRREELARIVERTTTGREAEPSAVLDGAAVERLRRVVRQVPLPAAVLDFITALVAATHPDSPEAPAPVRQYVRYGASPRGAQALALGAKVQALLDGRFAPSRRDVLQVLPLALRHRVVLNYEGQAEAVTSEDILERVARELG